MSIVDTAGDVAVLWTLDFDAELPCESTHVTFDNKNCSSVAFGVKSSCGQPVLICKSAYTWNAGRIADGRTLCAGCSHLAAECWSIRPI